jgi:uncharacterized protein (DUF2147 family)
MKHFLIVLLVALVIPAVPAVAQGAGGGDAIIGVWHTAEDKSQVQIFKLRNHYFGRIISLKDPIWPANDEMGQGGRPKTDRRNPNLELHTRPIVGLQIMHDFVLEGNNRWGSGKVYDPESGKTYKGKLTLDNPNRLELRGYVGISLLGRTEIWTR